VDKFHPPGARGEVKNGPLKQSLTSTEVKNRSEKKPEKEKPDQSVPKAVGELSIAPSPRLGLVMHGNTKSEERKGTFSLGWGARR
jgi:hypothetical protein